MRSQGRLRCIGSARFLKNNFGLGYMMRCSLKPNANSDQIVGLVRTFVQESSIVSQAGTELSIRMPKEAVNTFPELFESLESRHGTIGIESFGIETTTLEEVFMRIISEDEEEVRKLEKRF